MAFVNIRMTKEEMEEFRVKKILSPQDNYRILRPSRWTVDKGEDVFLIQGGCDGREGHPENIYFILGWKGVNIPVGLTKSWVDGNTCSWELFHIEIPRALKDKRSEIIQSLKDALTIYAFNGNPTEHFNQTTIVQFSNI